LNPEYSGYVATGEVLELKYKDLRKEHMAIQPNFRKSGQGDGWAGAVDAQGNMAIEASVTVHSSKYYDFCRSKPFLWFFYDVLLVYNLLASACSFLPAPWFLKKSAAWRRAAWKRPQLELKHGPHPPRSSWVRTCTRPRRPRGRRRKDPASTRLKDGSCKKGRKE
jgi:hypothetical protein